jgi:hypothetical protein
MSSIYDPRSLRGHSAIPRIKGRLPEKLFTSAIVESGHHLYPLRQRQFLNQGV